MTEREYDGLLDVVQAAIEPRDGDMICSDPGEAPNAANDNDLEWPLTPFPEGWHASP